MLDNQKVNAFSNNYRTAAPATIACENQKEQRRIGEILVTSDLVGLYICCACELSSTLSSSSSPKYNGDMRFSTKEIDTFWEHIRCHHHYHRSSGKVSQKIEPKSPAKQIENPSNKAQERNNNNTQALDVIVIDDDEDAVVGDSDTSIEDALEKMMGEGQDLEKQLPHEYNEAPVRLDKMINEAYVKDKLMDSTRRLGSPSTVSEKCSCFLNLNASKDEKINENNPSDEKEKECTSKSENIKNLETEVIVIDDDEEEGQAYHSKSTATNNNNNLISTELLKNLLDINKSPTSLNVENEKETKAEALNLENIPNEPMESFDDDCETIVNGDLDSAFRSRKENLLNAKRDTLEQFLSSQNLCRMEVSTDETNENKMENGFEQVDPAVPQIQIHINFQAEQMMNNTYQSGMCSQQQEQFQFATTPTTANSPMQLATTTTTTNTPTRQTDATQFSTIRPLQQHTQPIQFPTTTPLHQHAQSIQYSTTTTTTTTTAAATGETHHTDSSMQHNNNLRGRGSTSATGNENHQGMPATDYPPLQCDFCPERFYASWQKICHEQVHESTQAVPPAANDIRPLQCNFCPERFAATWQKIRHERVHFLRFERKAHGGNEDPLLKNKYNNGQYKCNHCGIRTVSEEGFMAHLQRYHPIVMKNAEPQKKQKHNYSQTKPGHRCPQCPMVYKHKQSLKQHIQRRHPESTPDTTKKTPSPPPKVQLPPSARNCTPSAAVNDPSVTAHCVWHLQSSYQPALDSQNDCIESFGTLYPKECAT